MAAERPQYKIQADSDLIQATLNESIPDINKAMSMGADINHVDTLGRFALAIAAAKDDMKTLNRLLHFSADASTRGGDGHTALFAAVSQGHEAIVKRLLLWDCTDTEDIGAAAVLAAQRDKLPLCAFILKKLSQVDEARCTTVLQQLQQTPQMTQRLDQAILEAWVADLSGQPQQQAELEEHVKMAEAQMQGVEQLLFRVAALARNQQPDVPAVGAQAAKRARGQ